MQATAIGMIVAGIVMASEFTMLGRIDTVPSRLLPLSRPL